MVSSNDFGHHRCCILNSVVKGLSFADAILTVAESCRPRLEWNSMERGYMNDKSRVEVSSKDVSVNCKQQSSCKDLFAGWVRPEVVTK